MPGTIEVNGKKFEVPKGQFYCEKCGTTNFIYNDMEPPYKCDECNSSLNESDLIEVNNDLSSCR